MADTVTKIGITFETFGDTKIKKAFGNLGKEVSVLKRNFGSLSDKSIKKVKEELNPEGGAYGLGRTHGHKH